ncbi:unnamed protein product [Diamesa hyperborea]
MEKLRRLVTEKKLTTDIIPFVLVKEFYKKCSDRETIDNLEAIPLTQLMKNLGGWPILEQSWNEDEFQWNETSKLFISHGFIEDYLVEMSMSVDICAPLEDLRNQTKSYHYIRINELQRKYPYMKWLSFVKARVPKSIEIDDNEEVLYLGTDFLEKFGQLIEVTPKRTIANYLFWRIADLSVNYLSRNIRLIKLKFSEILSGTKSLDQGWKKCITESVYSYKHAIGSMYIQRNLKENDQIGATQLVKSIIEKVKQSTEKSRWMMNYPI